MNDLESRVKKTLYQVFSYWRLYLTPGHGHFTITSVQPLVGALYIIKIECSLWEVFTFDLLYLDGDTASVFIDAYMLSHFTEFMIEDRTGE